MKTLTLAVLLTTLTLLTACATVVGSGRSQFQLVPLETEMSLGAQAWDETMAEAELITSGPDYEMVQRIGQRIAAAAPRLPGDNPANKFDWQFVLLDDPNTVNAWALPGGKSAVYSGLLNVTQDEDSLAMVIGHEVFHALGRHGAERMTQSLGFNLVMQLAGMSVADMPPEQADTIMQALGMAGTYGALMPFSRAHESEADEWGLYLAADAGYDPRTVIGLWERMAAANSGLRPPEILSTHPSENTRIQRLQAAMPRALEIWRAAQKQGR
jgi:predicted Zn-dependent protease